MPADAQNKILSLPRFTPFKRTLQAHESLRLWYLLLTLLLCLPIIFTTYIPLIDYPNHLARIDILARYHQVSLFQKNYGILFQPIPNLAMDIIVPPLASLVGTILAGKLFLLALFCFYAYGCYLLASELFGHETRAAFVPLFFIYNSTFLWGFINYAAGIALFLVTFALWLRWKSKWTFQRFAAFSALVSLCYLFHLSSITILGLSIFSVLSWELLTKRARWTQPLISGCAAIPAVVAYLTFMRGSGRMGQMELNTVAGKLVGLLTVVRGYSLLADAALAFGLLATVVYFGRRATNITVNMFALLPGLLLLAVYFVCPLVMYTSSAADVRFVWPAFVLLVLSFRIRIAKRDRAICVGLISALFMTHVAVTWWNWHGEDTAISRIVRTFDKLPRSATLYPAFFKGAGIDAQKHNHGLEHVACYAVITRDAFVPSVFALSGQQPLVLKGPHPFHVWERKSFNPNQYEYMWAFKPPQELRNWLSSSASLIAQEGDSTLWKLPHSATGVR